MRGRLIAIGLVVAALTGCAQVGAAPGAPSPTVPADAVRVVANGMAFDEATVSVPAGRAFTLALENREQVPHNVVIRDGAGKTLSEGEVFGGPGTRSQQVPALAAGSYPFLCALHPDMKGSIDAR